MLSIVAFSRLLHPAACQRALCAAGTARPAAALDADGRGQNAARCFSAAAADDSKAASGSTHYQETQITEEDLRARKSRAATAWMEANLGKEKLAVAKLLKDHGCLVRGGAEQGQKLIDSLLKWKAEGQTTEMRL